MKKLKKTKPAFTCCFLFFIVFIACSTTKDEVKKVAINHTDSCTSVPSHTYCIYIPSNLENCENPPLVIILDPHGSGQYALQKFIPASEKYGCILAASNLIRNNYTPFNLAIETLIADIKTKYRTGTDVFLAGFSGGSRMALSYAQQHKVNGVLAAGALATAEQINAIPSTIYALIGMSDFNFPEVAGFILHPQDIPKNLSVCLAGDLHEWPDSMALSDGLGYLFLKSSTKMNNCMPSKKGKKEYAEKAIQKIDNDLKNNHTIDAFLLSNALSKINEFPEHSLFSKKSDELLNGLPLKIELQEIENTLAFEFKVREAYSQAILTKDTSWWSNEIKVLDLKIKTETNTYQQNAYKRIKSYLGILCYTLTRNALQSEGIENCAKYLTVYQLVEPNNADMFYFSALYAQKTSKPKLVVPYLQKALLSGFTDIELIRNNFSPEVVELVFKK